MIATPAPGVAQFSASFDAGMASIKYDEYLRSSVFTLTPSLRLDRPLSTITARSTLSLFESGSKSVDLGISATTFTRATGIWRGEFSGSAGGTVYNGFGTGYTSASARLHAIGERTGLWLGGNIGYVNDGVDPISVTRVAAGAWARMGVLTANVVATHLNAGPVDLSDIEAGLRLSRGTIALAGNAGVRLGANELFDAKNWGELSLIYWVSRHVAFTVAHGRYPSEAARGTPGANYTSLALRLASRPSVFDVAVERTPRYETPAIARPNVAGFQVRNLSDTTHILTIRAPGARRIEIAGDFTGWEPVEMERRPNSDNFTLKVHAPAGSHKFNVRVDAGEWGVPPGVPIMRDEFSSIVAVLIIPLSWTRQ